ncbi:glycosyltransferase [Fredinandcohnia sp. 179-A 10B2 NHS]|uniref:glycosyltransferase n=1 Tax=Fredinandcohnia sp. 179-A 10B2 NHS TaxID=3235176 RepID=UPI0039A01784
MKPAISIIVPVYNLEEYLRDCIDSILDQTFTDFEVILVNDGSTDGSGKISDEYAIKDNRVRVIHKEYRGVSSARNAGINAAKGEYIGFIDGDDYIDPKMYSSLYEICTKMNSDISICKLGRVVNGTLINSGEKEFVIELNHLDSMNELFKGALYRFSLCNKLFKKSCFKNIQFPEGRIHEDLSTTYKLFANANKAVYTNYIGYMYVKRENSILTSTFNEKRLDAFLGWDEILRYMSQKYPQLSETVFTSFGYWCVDNVYYVLNQVVDKDERKKYLKMIQSCVRKYYGEIIRNESLSLMYKYLISLLNYNLRLLVIIITLKGSINAGRIRTFFQI